MMTIMLSNDTTKVDMDLLAQAFPMARRKLEDGIRVGTVTYWFELGASDGAKPRMVFHANDTGIRVTLDSVGTIFSRAIVKTRALQLFASRHEGSVPGAEDLNIGGITCVNSKRPKTSLKIKDGAVGLARAASRREDVSVAKVPVPAAISRNAARPTNHL